MKGKIVVVTGATSGIGKEIARGLARKGATVILGARNEEKARGVRDEIAKDAGSGTVSTMLLDVASQSSIRDFAREFREKHDRLDVLVNNAGVWFSDRREAQGGIELTWATNVIGPFLMVKELEPSLRKSPSARVVNIASGFASDYDPNDVEFRTRKYDGYKAYGQSKLAVRMLTWWQAEHFAGTAVTVNAAAPGFVRTDFMRNAKGFMAAIINLSTPLFAVTPEKGAATPIWVASAPQLEKATSKFYDGMKEKDGKFRDGTDELARICERMTSQAEAA